MQWLMLLGWGTLAVYGARTPPRALLARALMTAGLIVSMASQLWLLNLDGQLTLSTGLPLHLCGLFGVLSIPLLWLSPPWLLSSALYLGAPCALLTLCFPAVIGSSQPSLMFLAFTRLHALIVCVPILLTAEGRPLPRNPRVPFVLGNGYLLLVSVLNRLLNTNYLFLRAAPSGTPLSPLFERGGAFYICALEMLCMLLMAWLARGFRLLEARRRPATVTSGST